MISRRVRLIFAIGLGVLAIAYGLLSAGFYAAQDVFIYNPTHQPAPAELKPWLVGGRLFGYCREVESPQAVWLILQGNTGQAGSRGYFRRVAAAESLYILEYPGYGAREGKPTANSINAAAQAAYHELRRRFPVLPIGVVGESFGSGPACWLTREARPPDGLVLFVPLARLDLTMSRFIPLLPMRLLLRDNWDNTKVLPGYRGPVTIYAAEQDAAIPRKDTLLLHRSLPTARLIWVPGGHNDAGESEVVRISLTN